MTISHDYEAGDSITELWRALRLFTNRRRLIRLFSSYLNEDPPPEKILFFYGEGGNGKSLLVEYLYNFCSRRFARENWAWLAALSNDELMQQIKDAEGYTPVPTARIDFAATMASAGSYQQAFYGLANLRAQLIHGKLAFPSFEYAVFWYSHKTGLLSDDQLKKILPAEEMDLGGELVNYFTNNSKATIVKSVANLMGKYALNRDVKTTVTRYWQQRGVGADVIARIEGMDAERELVNYLPDFFAQDLKAALRQPNAPERVALMFDTHEAFWSEKRDRTGDSFFAPDEWLRRLLIRLYDEPRIVKLVAGRETPDWDAPRYGVAAEKVDAHLVGHLSAADAAEFLHKAAVEDEDFRACMEQHSVADKNALYASLVAYTEVRADEVHPFYLGLTLDIVLAAWRKGERLTAADFDAAPLTARKEEALIDRFLRYIDLPTKHAVYALAACRTFDFEIFKRLGGELDFTATAATFQILRGFSFVWQAERGAGWYRIHDLLRRLFAENHAAELEPAQRVMESYYRERAAGEEIYLVEAIYHANRLDWQRGAAEWAETFDRLLPLSRYETCRAWLEIRRELLIDNDFMRGGLAQSAANYYFSLSQYEAAEREYNSAVDAYDKALQLAPDLSQAHNNKGIVLQRRGDLEAGLTRTDAALQSYQAAVDAFDKALQLAPDYVAAHNNKGIVLVRRGSLRMTLEQSIEACQDWTAAEAEFARSLRIAPNDARMQQMHTAVTGWLDEHCGGQTEPAE